MYFLTHSKAGVSRAGAHLQDRPRSAQPAPAARLPAQRNNMYAVRPAAAGLEKHQWSVSRRITIVWHRHVHGAGQPLSAGTPGMHSTAPGRVPQSAPAKHTQGNSPLLLPPYLLGISPTQSGRPQCPLRSGLQPPAQGQPGTHGRYWHAQHWCRMGLPTSHMPKSRLCVLLCSSMSSFPGCLCLKSRSPRHHPLLKGSHQVRFGQAARKPYCSPVK